MFCPKCGTKNPEDGKFCRSCGVDLGNVSAALNIAGSNRVDAGTAHIFHEAKRRNDPNEVYGDSIKSIILGFGFLIVSMALLFTGVAGGHAWWWSMLFPAFSFLAKGVSDLMKSKRMMQASDGRLGSETRNVLSRPATRSALPPNQTEFVAPESRYRTGDLVPPSVTDSTTKLLELDVDGETKALPKA